MLGTLQFSQCRLNIAQLVFEAARYDRTFTEVQRDLEEAARLLRETKEPKDRRAILKEMSMLLKEAHNLNFPNS